MYSCPYLSATWKKEKNNQAYRPVVDLHVGIIETQPCRIGPGVHFLESTFPSSSPSTTRRRPSISFQGQLPSTTILLEFTTRCCLLTTGAGTAHSCWRGDWRK